MATVQRDPGLKTYSGVMGRNNMGGELVQEKNDFLIPAQAVHGVLVVGEDGVNSDIDIEHHEIVRLNDSLVMPDARNYTSISPSQKQPDELDRNTQLVRSGCNDCVFGDSGCIVTCPRHHNPDLPYATSVSSSPDSANTPGSRSSLSTFSVLSVRCSEAPSIASELSSDINKEKEKGKGKESAAEVITVPEQVHISATRSITESSAYEQFREAVPAERKRLTSSVAPISSKRKEEEEDPDNISTNSIQRATQTVDNIYPANTTRERDGGKVVAFMLPNEHAGVRHGNQGPTTMTSSSTDSSSYGYRGDPTRRTGYKWLMLIYLTVLNPLICLANAILTICVLSILTLSFPFKKLIFCLRTPSQATLPTSTNDVSADRHLLWSIYLSVNVRKRLSSPLFLHIRIMYQTSRPPPLPEEWDSNRLIVVHLLAPVVSIVPCGMVAWGAALMWAYSVMLGEGNDEERTGGWGRSTVSRGGRDVDDGYRNEEFYALRFVRKQWERWLWSALS